MLNLLIANTETTNLVYSNIIPTSQASSWVQVVFSLRNNFGLVNLTPILKALRDAGFREERDFSIRENPPQIYLNQNSRLEQGASTRAYFRMSNIIQDKSDECNIAVRLFLQLSVPIQSGAVGTSEPQREETEPISRKEVFDAIMEEGFAPRPGTEFRSNLEIPGWDFQREENNLFLGVEWYGQKLERIRSIALVTTSPEIISLIGRRLWVKNSPTTPRDFLEEFSTVLRRIEGLQSSKEPEWITITLVPTNTKKKINMFDIPEKLKNVGFTQDRDFKLQSGVLLGNVNSPKFQEMMSKFDEWIAKQMFNIGRVRVDLDLGNEYSSTETRYLFQFPFPMEKNEETVRKYFANKCVEDITGRGFPFFYSVGNCYYKRENAEEVEEIINKYDNDLTKALADPRLKSEIVKKIVNKEDMEQIEILTSLASKKSIEEFLSKKEGPFSLLAIPDNVMTKLSVVLKNEEEEKSSPFFSEGDFSSLEDNDKIDWIRSKVGEHQIILGYNSNFTSQATAMEKAPPKYVEIYDALARSASAFRTFSELARKYQMNVGTQDIYRGFYEREQKDFCYDYLIGLNEMNAVKVNQLLSGAYFTLARPEASRRDPQRAYKIIESFIEYIIAKILREVSEQSVYREVEGEDELNEKKRKNLRSYFIRVRENLDTVGATPPSSTTPQPSFESKLARSLIKNPIAFLERYPTVEAVERSEYYMDIVGETSQAIEECLKKKSSFEDFWTKEQVARKAGEITNKEWEEMELNDLITPPEGEPYLKGATVIVIPSAENVKKSYPAANWIKEQIRVTLGEDAPSENTVDVIDAVQVGTNIVNTIYSFNIVGYALTNQQILDFWKETNSKIETIKKIREITGWGLAQSKEYLMELILYLTENGRTYL